MPYTFAIASDLHIALPHTVWDSPHRFHLVEFSIPAFEVVLARLATLPLDFLLLPGDLTQHGEPENHEWLASRLAQLPYPVYVIPGNHDVPTPPTLQTFAECYRPFGYSTGDRLYYCQRLGPDLALIGLNSNQFINNNINDNINDNGDCQQIGWVDEEQLSWLAQTLAQLQTEGLLPLVMVHHNVVEHLPGQATNPIGRRYMLGNAEALCTVLHRGGARLVFTGHLHVQDIAYSDRHGLYDVTTGSLVSYPHPYRLLTLDRQGDRFTLTVRSERVTAVPACTDLLTYSRTWMGDRSRGFLLRLLTQAPLCLPPAVAEELVPHLRYFWADLAAGDAQFSFPQFPPAARAYFENFSDRPPADNDTVLANIPLAANSSPLP